MDRQQFIVFTAAGVNLALPIGDVRRVVPQPLLEIPPGAPRFVEGFFDLAGVPVAAVRLDRLLNLGDDRLGVYAPLLLLRREDPPIALHVTRVVSIVRLTGADIQPIGREETFNACIVGRFSRNGETIYVLSVEDILLAEERAAISAHQATRARRLKALSESDMEATADVA